MRLLASGAEMKAVRTMCGDNDKLTAMLLGVVDVPHFYYNPAKEAFKSVLKTVRGGGNAPDWTEVCNDTNIREDSRAILKAFKEPPVSSSEKVKSLIRTLDKFRKLRGLLDLAQNILDNVESETVDLDDLVDQSTNMLTNVRVRGDAKNAMFHIGKGNNTSGLVKDMLYGKKASFVPTGFRAHDDRNGGILRGSLFTIGASTGGGKTALAVNLLNNMTSYGFNVCMVPLEMTAQQTLDRWAGIRTGVPVTSISQKKLSKDEKKLIKRDYKKRVQELKDTGTRYSIYEPPEDMTIEELLLTLKPYKHDVILIDYISLLKGADGDDQWKALGRISRFAKVFAKNNDCIVILLCQVSEDGKIRYAQSIAENSNNAWTWVMTGDDEETSILEIKQLKARNQLRFPFQLQSHNPTMRIGDVEGTPMQDADEDEDDGKKLRDVNDDAEDED